MTLPRTEVRLEPHAAKQFDRAPASVQADVRRKARRLSENPQAGVFISVRRVPKASLRRWEARVGAVTNLYKVDLVGAWRALYTVGSDGPLRVVLILEILDHTGYDRLLGYG